MSKILLETDVGKSPNVYYLDQDNDFRPFNYESLFVYKQTVSLSSYERTITCDINTELDNQDWFLSKFKSFFIPLLYIRKL